MEGGADKQLAVACPHRDYIVLGSEIHIDMFDDRVEITSPGDFEKYELRAYI